jgi:hypothetical protein
VVESNEGIVQFSLDPMTKQPITCGKGAGINVQENSLTTYFSEMTFCNYPQLLLIHPERQNQVETIGKKLLKQVIKNCFSRKYSSSSHMLTTQTNKRCHTLWEMAILFCWQFVLLFVLPAFGHVLPICMGQNILVNKSIFLCHSFCFS